MSRVLIAIGCDHYDDVRLNSLSGAEKDASAIFEKLVTEKLGQFDLSRSSLLLSPTLADIRLAIGQALFSAEAVDCLTLFYAGHGGVRHSAYFLMCRDSNLDRLSLSSLSMSVLFSHINEAKCGHTNIIIDACQSGGVVNDIGSLLKPEVIGKAGAISVSILAAAASDQNAEERNGHGYCTNALLDCISGKIEIPSLRPTLDLIDIGQTISPKLAEELGQTPECWGISLKGHVPLCANPHANAAMQPKAKAGFAIGLPPEVRALLDGEADKVWKQYFTLEAAAESEQLLKVLRGCVAALDGHPLEAVDFIHGVSSAFRQKIVSPHSGFEEAEVIGVAVTSISHLVGSNDAIDAVITKMLSEINDAVTKGIDDLNAQMTNERYYLLSSGYAEFYFLPLRISKILGWIGAASQIANSFGLKFSINAVKRLFLKLIEDYSCSVFSVSDSQAPYLASFVSAADHFDCRNEAETLTCLMFSSFLKIRGRIASTDISGDQIIKYLISTTGTAVEELDRKSIAQPSELLALFFVLYSKFEMADLLDESLADLDHHHFNLFIPDRYNQFGQDLIRAGQNYTFQVGHGIWATSDFAPNWSDIRAHIAKNDDTSNPLVATSAVVASLIIPDRTAWFLLSDVKII